MHSSVIMTRITSLYGSQTSPVVLCMQKVWLAPEFIVSMGPTPHLSFCSCKTKWLASEILVAMCPRPHLWFFAFKTATLAPELQFSMGASPHLWFLHAKQRLLNQNYKSLLVPYFTYDFCIQNGDFSTRIASLYRSQPSSVVLVCKKATFG